MKGVDPVTGLRKSYYGKTESEALQKAQKATKSDDSLCWFYEKVYFPTISMRSRNYRTQVSWVFDQHIAPRIGNMNLEDITRQVLQRHFNTIGLSHGSMRIIRAVMHSIFKLAEEDGLIPKNPVKGVRIVEEGPKQPKGISAADLWKLYENAGELRPFILLTGFAGLRQGEALGASFTAIKGDVLTVHQQVLKKKGGTEVSPKLKTKNSYREIPLPFDLGPKRIWICDEDGKYMTPGMSDYYLRRLCTQLDMEPVGPHALRHTFITIMEDEVECPRRIVQALVGHAGKEITDGYSKVSIEAKRRWMKKFWEHMTTIGTTEFVVQEAAGNLN